MTDLDIDIDIEEIEQIRNPDIRNLVKQLKMNGMAFTRNNDLGRKISRKFPETRKKDTPVFLIGTDPKVDMHWIAFNFPLFGGNGNKELERYLKMMVRGFK